MQTFSSLQIKLGRFKITDKHLNNIWAGQQNGKIRLFKLIDIMITYRYIDSGEYHNILSELCKYHFDYYASSSKTDLETIAIRLNYTREHIRTNKIKFKCDFNKKFNFLRDIDFIEEVTLPLNSSIIEVNEDVAISINKENQTDFTKKFITRIFSLFNTDYNYVCDDDNPSWKSAYLVSNRETDYVSIVNLYRIKLRPYPSRKVEDIWYFEEIPGIPKETSATSILEKLITKEIGDNYYNDKGLLLPKTKRLTLLEKIMHIFHDFGPERQGYKIDQIIEALEKREGETFRRSSIRSTINGNPLFSAYGKTSTYILSEWLDDEKLDIISGDYWRVCQRLLEREEYPLDIITLMERLSYHRHKPDKKSLINILGDKTKNIFIFKESFVGLLKKEKHLSFINKLKNIHVNAYSPKFWEKFNSENDVHDYFQRSGVISAQIAYLIKYMRQEIKPPIILRQTNPNSHNNKSEENLLTQLAELESQKDLYTQTKSRREHLLLKQLLFHNKTEMSCAICGRKFPTNLLAVAHIKRRALATETERINRFIVMAACYLGCDMLYEKGYLTVDQMGNIEILKEDHNSIELNLYTEGLKGKACNIYNASNKVFFDSHRDFHKKKLLIKIQQRYAINPE
ncbi:hypothetical protein [Pedobacter sp. Leaf170]|uniref:hypothetical protein n=1 Tax=Pedobacter sp. Leaf170 TaxID=2876558 RepID=UPI001E509DD7|nr:hypothetical protein [Pedobacter sp. Leaf170]